MMRCFIWVLLFSVQAWAEPDFSMMKHTAQLSALAYVEGGKSTELESMGHKLVREATLPVVEVSYFLSVYQGMQYLTVRGTANLQNAMVDLDIHLKQDEQLGIAVHQGFANAALAIFNDAKPYLNQAQGIRTTGHSLGGAAAVMLAMYLQEAGFKMDQLITFGQPKVTNVGGANRFSNLKLWRVVTTKDIVPLVPPLSPLQISNLDVYWHMGEEIILLEGSNYSVTSGVKSMLRATKFVTSVPNESNLEAHKMHTYLTLIQSKQAQANEVPYKSDFSMFGFGGN
ncbi:lipase family protein [Bermanella sp. WJH001]|uniref:lipase family protein n=1 Tax=Bermanella sp. WJH001 TaxID=3048005 RepID=UPI0024BEF3A8|nr:lipase family protein [Bermanella sp. WJH001]MDJ1537595.1 lipase family protein [Bermanella sp. WJH001]